jgi:C1A family cysteine protease
LQAGDITLDFDVTVSRFVPSSLAHLDIEISSEGSAGKLLCAKITTSPGLAVNDGAWEAFKNRYGKFYNGPDHEAEHRQVYESNMQLAAENSNDETQFGENQFADLTQAQYRAAAGLGYKPSAAKYGALPKLGVHTWNGEALAATVDWTTQGAVTPVKDQGQCGSCWAFSTTGGLEGAWQIASGSLQSLSEQQFVDCAPSPNAGCNGGDMGAAFEFAESQNIATESSYPYKGTDGTCASGTTAIPSGGVTGYKSVGQSTADLKSALNSNPVSVAIEADQIAFQMYSGGILKDTGGFFGSCGTNLDHGVLAVGYGDGYFKVKNSWGASWGESGYLQISDEGNTCGIHSDATYPTVSASVSV